MSNKRKRKSGNSKRIVACSDDLRIGFAEYES